MRRSRRVSTRRVRFGRGTGNEVSLPDIRVDLIAAALFMLGSGALMIEALGFTPLRVNGVATRATRVQPGDEVAIGPYQVVLTPPPPGVDVALSYELVQPLGTSLAELRTHSRIGLEETGISKRRAAWIGALLILLVGFAAPIAVLMTNSAGHSLIKTAISVTPARLLALFWKPGEMANAHRFFAAECKTCHQMPFARVADRACLACHGEIGNHIPAHLQAGGAQDILQASRCTDCHEEHRGSRALVVSDTRLCLDCHRSLAQSTPAVGVRNVTSFPAGHPQFRATIVADATGPKFERVTVGSTPGPVDHPGVKFSHAAHLVSEGFPALGIKPMVCSDCHVAEPSGQGFQPIAYKQQCARCHSLEFASQEGPWPQGRVPHGDDSGIVAAVWNFYAGKVIGGGMVDAPTPVLRRIPGSPLPVASTAREEDAQRWVAEHAETALRTIVFDEKRGCAYCHYGTGPNGQMQLPDLRPAPAGGAGPRAERVVAPVLLRSRFLPDARFDHKKHAALPCEQCHAARTAEAVGALLIPGIETCAGCHGSEDAALRAQSTCTTCHQFHYPGFGPMRGIGKGVDDSSGSPAPLGPTPESKDRGRSNAGL